MSRYTPLKIVLTGPESTGKSTLSAELAKYYQTLWNPEYARFYLSRLQRPYVKEDILKIARGQLQWENTWCKQANKLLVCDTALLVPKIWSLYKYKVCDQWINDSLQKKSYDFYFLCGTDWPWEYDPMRETPHEREELFQLYKQELLAIEAPFIELTGNFQKRFEQAVVIIDSLLKERKL